MALDERRLPFEDREDAMVWAKRAFDDWRDVAAIHWWLLGCGQDRAKEGDQESRRSFEAQLRASGWTVETLEAAHAWGLANGLLRAGHLLGLMRQDEPTIDGSHYTGAVKPDPRWWPPARKAEEDRDECAARLRRWKAPPRIERDLAADRGGPSPILTEKGMLVMARYERRRALLARWASDALVNTHGEVFRAAYDGELPVFIGPAGAAREIAIQYRYFRRGLGTIGETPVQVQVTPRRAWQVKLESGTTLALGRENIEARLARFVAVHDRALGRLGRRIDYVDLRYANGFAVRIPELRHEKAEPKRGRRTG